MVPIISFVALATVGIPPDPFSHSNPGEVAVTHMDLDLRVSVAPRELAGRATLQLARAAPGDAQELVLDTKSLRIAAVESIAPDGRSSPLRFDLGPADPVLGAALTIGLPPHVTSVRVDYRAGDQADALQWLAGTQTRSGRDFLYTQSGTIHARSWIPTQDSPAVRFTWDATVRAPPGLVAVMSGTPVTRHDQTSQFHMARPVPAYLIALAVGDLAFQPWDGRTGVYAAPGMIADAQRELRDVPRMLVEAERLFGRYQWDRYDLLIMPPAFPYGGVENAQLTFVTPTLLVGDGSQVSTAAHELAHAWAGNLVTQATWNDVWIGEGLAVYLERRIVEAVYGGERAAAEAVLGHAELSEELADLPPADQRLRVDFTGRNPDDALSSVPYEKGYLFFLWLERRFGRARLDAYLRRLFAEHAFQSISTAELLASLGESLPAPFAAWVEEPGLPADAPDPSCAALDASGAAARRWVAGAVPTRDVPTRAWSPYEWAWFLRSLPPDLDCSRVSAMDEEWRLSASQNPSILVPWLLVGIRCEHPEALQRAAAVLRAVGRGRVVVPLYEALIALPGGQARARSIYCGARGSYHPVIRAALDRRVPCPE